MTEKFAVTFTAGANGNISATVDGAAIASGDTIEKNKTVIFTAAPASGYMVDAWTGATPNASDVNKASLVVTAAATVSVSFVLAPADPDMVSITPAGVIEGQTVSYTLPGTDDYWKGVFISGRNVTLSPFQMGKYEVSYELWYEVKTWAVTKGYVFANKGLEGWDGTGGGGSYPNYANIGKPPTANKNHPVTMISWRDCVVWCNAYTEKTNNSDAECVYRSSGAVIKAATNADVVDAAVCDLSKKGYRLPTEAEWEYAARYQGTDHTNAQEYGPVHLTKLNAASGAKKPLGFGGLALPAGESWATLRDEATRVAVYRLWWDGTDLVAQDPATTGTAKVGSKAANALGLYDMSGNVWEWCFDKDGAVSTGTVTNPIGPASGSDRVNRGGGWYHHAFLLALGCRNNNTPDIAYNFLGFRLCRTQ